jgi:hypothetical protein
MPIFTRPPDVDLTFGERPPPAVHTTSDTGPTPTDRQIVRERVGRVFARRESGMLNSVGALVRRDVPGGEEDQ